MAITAQPELELDQYRKELTGYCYRMLGSAFEAEDAVQETMVRAWRAFDRFEGRSSVRRWLYRIATNVCLKAIEGRQRRALPMDLTAASPGTAQLGAPRPEATWIEPIPDDRVIDASGDPAEVAAARESVRLAFVTALQHLPPRQRAVLILRDVLRWRASEVANLLETSVVSVNSALQRARESLARNGADAGARPASVPAAPAAPGVRAAPAAPADEAQRRLIDRYVDAFVRFDVDTLVALLREDAQVTMPPYDTWFSGPEDYVTFLLTGPCGGDVALQPVAANGSPAFAVRRRAGEPVGIQVLEVAGDGIAAIHMFLAPQLFPLFGLEAVSAG